MVVPNPWGCVGLFVYGGWLIVTMYENLLREGRRRLVFGSTWDAGEAKTLFYRRKR